MTFTHLARHIARRFYLLEDIRKYGFIPTLRRLNMLREAWVEKGNKVMVGKDKYGNTYWQTTESTEVHRNRWVELKGKSSQFIYEPSAVPSEWHGWLHYSRDEPPTQQDTDGTTAVTPQRLKVTHRANPTGTKDQYFTPHHIFNAVHTNPKQNPHAQYKRPSPQDVIKEHHDHFARDYHKIPLDELNEEKARYL